MKPVAVLGAGPAGLIAAHTAALMGHPVAVLSAPGPDGVPVPSRLGGAQFLHEPIPQVNDDEPDAIITYKTEGTAEGYYDKVYRGDPTVPFVSMSHIQDGMTQKAWNLVATYERLWRLLEPCIQPKQVDSEYVEEALEKDWFSTIISSVPAPALCMDQRHVFASVQSHIANEGLISLPENTVLYSGMKDRSWHRASNLFGVASTEWPGHKERIPFHTVTVSKPVKTTCKCFPSVVRVGRYGTWTKGTLVNDSMGIVREALSS